MKKVGIILSYLVLWCLLVVLGSFLILDFIVNLVVGIVVSLI